MTLQKSNMSSDGCRRQQELSPGPRPDWHRRQCGLPVCWSRIRQPTWSEAGRVPAPIFLAGMSNLTTTLDKPPKHGRPAGQPCLSPDALSENLLLLLTLAPWTKLKLHTHTHTQLIKKTPLMMSVFGHISSISNCLLLQTCPLSSCCF